MIMFIYMPDNHRWQKALVTVTFIPSLIHYQKRRTYVLTVSAEKEERDERYSRKEFSYTSFSRSFTLPDWVNKDKIDASYENGLLKVNLPKTEEAKKLSSKHIAVK